MKIPTLPLAALASGGTKKITPADKAKEQKSKQQTVPEWIPRSTAEYLHLLPRPLGKGDVPEGFPEGQEVPVKTSTAPVKPAEKTDYQYDLDDYMGWF